MTWFPLMPEESTFMTGQKKTSGVPTHPRGPALSFFSPPTSSRCSPVTSRRTVRRGGEDRSWFGRPQAIKKGGRECRQQQGVERVEKRWTLSSGTTLFRRSGVPWVRFTYCEKRRGPTPSQFDALPLHRRSTQRITRGSPTGRRHYDQTTNGVSNPRKSRGPTLCSVRRIGPPYGGLT